MPGRAQRERQINFWPMAVRRRHIAGRIGYVGAMKLDPLDSEYGRFVDVYIDESSRTAHRYLLFGALTLPTRNVEVFEQAIWKARAPEVPADHEMKWNNASVSKLPAYERVVNTFFDNTPKVGKPFDFHCQFFDTLRTDDMKYNKGSRKVGLGKEMFQLIMRCAHMHKKSIFRLFPDDDKKTPEDALKLKIILNRRLAKEGDARIEPFRHVEFLESKDSIGLQVADILTGAIGYELNDWSKAKDASKAKVTLSRYILRERFHLFGNILYGTPERGRYTIRPVRR